MASDITPLRKRPYPAETDTPDVAADVKSLALSLDNCPNVTQGTLANRPSTGMVAGDRYYVTGDSTLTNNGIEWIYDGSSWVQITQASPIGAGDIWFGDSDPADTRWLICDGRAISRTTYAELFALIGTTYGSGDGTTTFNLPDLRQRMPLGKKASGATGSGANLGEKGGQIDHNHTIPGLTVPSLTVPGMSFSGVSIPSLGVTVNGHSHSLSAAGGAQITGSDTSGVNYLEWGASGPNYTSFRQINNISAGSYTGVNNINRPSVALLGSTDSDGASGYTSGGTTGGGTTNPGSTNPGSTNPGTSGNQNPPYLTVNFIIRVQ